MHGRAELARDASLPDACGDLDRAFAPLSVKTPDADFAEILSGGTPDVWTRNPPAKTGDTGRMFQDIVRRALEMKAPRSKATTQDTKVRKAANTRKAKTATRAKKAG